MLSWELLYQSHGYFRTGRFGHSATVVGTKIFVLGGQFGSKVLPDLWEFDIVEKCWRKLQEEAPLRPRAFHTATLVGSNKLWVLGGLHGADVLGDIHVLDTDTLEWYTPPQSPSSTPRAYHAALVHPSSPGHLLVFGGVSTSSWLNDLALFNTETFQWTTLQPGGLCPSPRSGHSFTMFEHKAFLFGGENCHGLVKENLLNVFDAHANRWIQIKPTGEAPGSRTDHAADYVRGDCINGIVILGGRGNVKSSWWCDLYSLEICGDNLNYIWKEHIQKPKISTRSLHSLVACGPHLYTYGGLNYKGSSLREVYKLRDQSTTEQQEATANDESQPSSSRQFDLNTVPCVQQEAFASGEPECDEIRFISSSMQGRIAKIKLPPKLEAPNSTAAGTSNDNRKYKLLLLQQRVPEEIEQPSSPIRRRDIVPALEMEAERGPADKTMEKQDSSLLERAIELHEGARQVVAPEAGQQRQMHDKDIERALLRQVASLTNQLEQANDQHRIEREETDRKLEELTRSNAQLTRSNAQLTRSNAALSDQREETDRKLEELTRSNAALFAEIQQVKAAAQSDLELLEEGYKARRRP